MSPVGAAVVQVHLTECEHLARRYLHVIAAEINAIGVVRPGFDVNAERLAEFSDVVHSLGSGPSMAVFKHVETTNDLTRLSSKAKVAPAETYTLVSLEGIRSLENISPSVTKHGKLIKSVKIATRQQKFFNKTLGLIPAAGWLLIIFIATAFLIVLLRRAKS